MNTPTNFKMINWLFCGLLLCLLTAATQAQTKPLVTRIEPPKSVLFVGNSFTFYNNAIYTHLRKLLVVEDPSTRKEILLKSMTISGAKLSDHAGGLQQMLNSQPWDVIVLQGHSREAFEDEMAPEFESTARKFTKAIRAKGAEPVLFMTWAYVDQPKMITAQAKAIGRLGNSLNVMVVPVGLAFKHALKTIPGVILHDEDQLHPSLAGTYLAAAVFYTSLYAKSPVKLDYDAGLDEELARQLRQVAWDTVQNYYHPTGD